MQTPEEKSETAAPQASAGTGNFNFAADGSLDSRSSRIFDMKLGRARASVARGRRPLYDRLSAYARPADRHRRRPGPREVRGGLGTEGWACEAHEHHAPRTDGTGNGRCCLRREL
eukprot:scaffold3876_cov344-Prasinococcus_capsulatus_cf.AAC.7